MEPSTQRTGMDRRGVVGLGAFGAVTAAAVVSLGRGASPDSRWYRRLKKPPFQPPPWVFAPVWTVLYGMIALSGWRVWRARRSVLRTRALGLWGTQLFMNALWPRLFFRQQRPRAALLDLAFLGATVQAYRNTTRGVDGFAATLMLPYLAWLSFALVLNEELVRRN